MEWTRLTEYGPAKGSCEHGNEHSGSMKSAEILEQLQNLQPLKKGSASWGYFSYVSCRKQETEKVRDE
jgi:hypothetical protein